MRIENLQNLRFGPTCGAEINVSRSMFEIQGSSFWHGFHGRPAGGHLPKPLNELLPISWKLVPCQLQLANEQSLTRQEFICLSSPDHLVQIFFENLKCQLLNYPSLFHYTLIKMNKICIMFYFLNLVPKISVQRNIERQINV